MSFVSIAIPDDFDALYNQSLGENDPVKREQMYQQLNKMAMDTYCMVVPINQNQEFSARSSKVHDCGSFDMCVVEQLPERIWLSK
jgi:ABC-type transport system substrate-binding protein